MFYGSSTSLLIYLHIEPDLRNERICQPLANTVLGFQCYHFITFYFAPATQFPTTVKISLCTVRTMNYRMKVLLEYDAPRANR